MAIPRRLPGRVSDGTEQRDHTLNLDIDAVETLPQSVRQGSEIVLAIIEHALRL
jgi:hypothetical protein